MPNFVTSTKCKVNMAWLDSNCMLYETREYKMNCMDSTSHKQNESLKEKSNLVCFYKKRYFCTVFNENKRFILITTNQFDGMNSDCTKKFIII